MSKHWPCHYETGKLYTWFTVHLKGPNTHTVLIQLAMSHLEKPLQAKTVSVCFAKIDFAHAYWQRPLPPESHKMLSIRTPLGLHSSSRLLQGSTDADSHLQIVT